MRRLEDENALIGDELTLDDFEVRFLSPDGGAATVQLETETLAARAHFDHWLTEMRRRHPAGAYSEEQEADEFTSDC